MAHQGDFKQESEHLERSSLEQMSLEAQETKATYIDKDEVANLSADHRQYLLDRHGTLNLDPLPAFGDADPYNWPQWKKVINLILVSWHACMMIFNSASIIPAYEAIAQDLHVSLQRTTYLTSLQIAITGGAPILFWRPLSSRYGRRPIFLVSLLCSMVCNIGCAKSPSYASLAACSALVAFFISPAAGIGSAVVRETFFAHQRARYLGIWAIMVTLGAPTAPFLMGFVAQRQSYRWIYWILACINAGHLLLYIFFGPETRYIGTGVQHDKSSIKEEYYNFRRIDPTPLRVWDFISPFKYAFTLTVMIPAAAYAMVFLLAGVIITIEVPSLFAEKFHFGPQKIGLQFIGVIIGTILGEQIGGHLSDYWMNSKRRQVGSSNVPAEYRLWLSYPGTLLALCGVVVFLVQNARLPPGHYNVTPIVGAAIAAGGNQIVTTVMITYAVDMHPDDASGVGAFITFVRQIWGFIGPFWFPNMVEDIGLRDSAAVCAVLIIALKTTHVSRKLLKLNPGFANLEQEHSTYVNACARHGLNKLFGSVGKPKPSMPHILVVLAMQ
ncbi:MAG: hypothetical protein Q9162_004563 [Coniocarpon cinnabarinum]